MLWVVCLNFYLAKLTGRLCPKVFLTSWPIICDSDCCFSVFLLNAQMPVDTMLRTHKELQRDTNNLLRVSFKSNPAPYELPAPQGCLLEEELLPAAYRPAVQKLRDNAKQSFVTRLNAYKNAEKSWRRRAKSFTIDRIRK